MKSNMLKPIFIIAFLATVFLGRAQLSDPFGKIITHEIKLKKLDNGTYKGAIEWTTGGIDSLQKFIVKGLDVKAPVMVRIISKAPDHNIDLSFHKKSWDKVESKISTNGNKFVDKVFRTMNTAGLSVYSEVAGIPYLITVKVGLQFPSTKSLIRITDDKEEYAQHLRKMGYTGKLFSENNTSTSNNSNSVNSISSGNNNTLIYVVIGLLTIIIFLLAVFLLKRKSAKSTTLLLILLCSGQFCIAQTSQPKLVPIDGQGDSPVFYEYSTQNVNNQKTVPIENPQVRTTSFDDPIGDGTMIIERHVRIESNPESRELTAEEAAEFRRRTGEADEQFNRDYGEDSTGEETEGDQRTLPVDRDNEELNRLRNQVRRLQRQVDLLSQEDEEFEENGNEEAGIVILCDDIIACTECIQQWRSKLQVRDAYFQYLQNFYASEIKVINDKIALGNAWSNVHAVSAIVWQRILHEDIMPSVQNFRKAYSMKFDEYIESMRKLLESMESCNTHNPDGEQIRAIKNQAKALVEYYSRTKIIN